MGLLRRAAEFAMFRVLRGREMESLWLRDYMRQRYGLSVGLYSYGCFDPWRFPSGTVIGRYSSFAKGVRIINANHPITALSTHPYLYEKRFGIVDADHAQHAQVTIGDDVWIGHNVILTPGVQSVGRGAIIGAGAVVTRDVAPYAIVAGSPAKLIRFRFDSETIAALEASEWWTLSQHELKALAAIVGQSLFQCSTLGAAELRDAVEKARGAGPGLERKQ